MFKEKFSKDNLPDALDKVSKGFTIAEVAKEYGIDRSTLLRKLDRYYPEEMRQLRDTGALTKGGYRALSAKQGDLNEVAKHPAVIDILLKGMTYQEASDKYGIPKMTLYSRVKRVKDMTAKSLLLSDSNDNAI